MTDGRLTVTRLCVVGVPIILPGSNGHCKGDQLLQLALVQIEVC